MKIGLQVYSVREHLKENPEKTLQEVSVEGYKYIEFANHSAEKDDGIGFGYSASEMKRIVKETGITVLGAHIMPSDETVDLYADLDYFKRIIDYYVELGARYLVNPQEFFPTLDVLKQRCEVFNKIGEICKANGLRYLYHNHWNEYQLFGETTIFDHLMANTEAENMGIELDAFWTIRGLIDPVGMIRRYGDRIAAIHEKDFPLEKIDELNAWKMVDRTKIINKKDFHATVKPEHFTEVGDGIIKIQDVIDAGNEFNIPYMLVEQDHSRLGEMESIKVSMNNFRKMRGIEWDE